MAGKSAAQAWGLVRNIRLSSRSHMAAMKASTMAAQSAKSWIAILLWRDRPKSFR